MIQMPGRFLSISEESDRPGFLFAGLKLTEKGFSCMMDGKKRMLLEEKT